MTACGSCFDEAVHTDLDGNGGRNVNWDESMTEKICLREFYFRPNKRYQWIPNKRGVLAMLCQICNIMGIEDIVEDASMEMSNLVPYRQTWHNIGLSADSQKRAFDTHLKWVGSAPNSKQSKCSNTNP